MNEPKSTRYQRLARRVAVLSAAVEIALLAALAAGGGSSALRTAAGRLAGAAENAPSTIALYVILLGAICQAGRLPLTFYGTFLLDRRFGLSREPFRRWLGDHLKAAALLFVLALGAIELMYFAMRATPAWWWLVSAAAFWGGLLVLARITPTVLMPLFYRFTPLERASLRSRLELLSTRAGLPIMGVYVWTLGDRTTRANAALVGAGATRRILVSDTLLREYSDDEIEVILAHEMGHHAHRDIRTGMLLEGAVLTLGLAVAAALINLGWAPMGLRGPDDIAGLPLLVIAGVAVVLFTGPLLKAVSRRNERRADEFALRLTARPDAFISAMRRLGTQNLVEEQPSWMVQRFFHTHPSLAERIERAKAFARQAG